MIKIFFANVGMIFLIFLSVGFFKMEEYLLGLLSVIFIFICLYVYLFIMLSAIEDLKKEKIYKILKKIDTSLFKKIHIFLLFTKDEKEIIDSLPIIEKINQKDPEWFIRNVSNKIKIKDELLSNKQFINYLRNFSKETVYKYFKEDIENLKYQVPSNYNKNYDYFKELVKEKKYTKEEVKIINI